MIKSPLREKDNFSIQKCLTIWFESISDNKEFEDGQENSQKVLHIAVEKPDHQGNTWDEF